MQKQREMCAGRPPSKREEVNEATLLEGHFVRRPPLDCPKARVLI